MKFKFKYLFYAIVAILVIVVLQLFIKDSGGGVINEYTVYKNNSMNRLVNYKLKEDVKEAVKSTDGLVVATSGNYTTSDADAEVIWTAIKKWSTKYNTDSVFVAVICAQESTFGKDNSTSSAGARGPMQITDSPPIELKQKGLWESDMTTDFSDLDNSLHVGVCYLKYGYDKFIVPYGLEEDKGAWAAGYNSWWDKTVRKNPPYVESANDENKNYYYETKARYTAYITGAKKIGEK